MKFVKSSFLTFSAQIITVVLGLVISVILARELGPANMGIYSIVILIFTLLGLFGSLGISISNTYYGVKGEYKWSELASNSLIVAFVLGVILSVFFLLFFFFEQSFLKDIEPNLILISAVSTPFILLMPYFQYILLGQNRIKEYNFSIIFQNIFYLSLISLILLFLHGNLFGIIISWTFTSIVASIVPVVLVYKNTPFRLHFNSNIFKKTTKFGLQAYLGNVFQFLNYRVDLFLISTLSTFANVGYYSISVAIAESLWYLPGAVGTIVFARTPGLSDEDKNRLTPIICRNTFFVTLVLGLILIFLGKYIILFLFGSQYLPAIKPLWALIPGIIALSVCKVLSNEITGRGKPMINTYAAIISLLLNIPLNIILIPQLGILGSALASSISYTVTTVIVLVNFLKLSKNTVFDTLILKKEDIKIYKEIIFKTEEFLKFKIQ
ncbi:flippase [Methanobacterium ferruginis]|uniref:flippase n=1 Tax=Methanobacterium ferruginis TaxID=710191 RepID=UPI002574448A|nr:flippase [Methanobacterium ferruginis]BDZ69138.1 hypothetical protein GCM10025860_25860 [Methanobacterium ferruginis]